jgi:non-ribosomal peptide synthase protein (TIGR01720 family)
VAGTKAVVQAEQGIITGGVALTPIQKWFFEQDLTEPSHWNQSLLLEFKERLLRDPLETAVRVLFSHHDILRCSFFHSDLGWEATILEPTNQALLEWVDLTNLGEEDREAEIEKQCQRLQRSLDISNGPVGRVAYFDLGQGRAGKLLLLFHHLVVDGVSWRILMDDLLDGYQQAAQGKEPKLPLKSTSFQQWSSRISEFASTNELQQEAQTWEEIIDPWDDPLPVDFQAGENTEGSTASISAELNGAETLSLLQEVNSAYRTEIQDLLLAALSIAFNRGKSKGLLIELEGHGREDLFADVDISRTVGWFTALYPVQLPACSLDDPGQAIKATKETLRRIPRNGIGYGLLRYLSPEGGATLKNLPHPQITFNYLGQVGIAEANTGMEIAGESKGPERSLKARRTSLIDINGGVAGGRLRMEWTYSRNLHRAETIRARAEDYIQALQVLIQHCISPDTGGVTASDFKEFGWDEDDLSSILGEIEETEKKPGK